MDLKKAYIQGATAAEIAVRCGLSLRTVLRRLRQMRVPVRHRWDYGGRRCNESAFSKITPESAYWIGFLLADGCIDDHHAKSPRIALVLAAKDADHVVRFAEFLHAPPPHKSNDVIRFKVTSRKLVMRLRSFGVVPRKSLIANPKRLLHNRHFWRGVIDGDGWLRIRKNFVGHHKAVIGLCGSAHVVRKFCDYAKTIVPELKMKPRRVGNIFSVDTCGEYAMKIIRVLYADTLIALQRKKILAERILQCQ